MKHSRRSIAAAVFLILLNGGLPETAPALPFAGRNPGNKITASDAENDDSFGRAAAVSGRHLVVGAEGENGVGGDNRGAAYVYDLETGVELLKLIATDTQDDDLFGVSVAVSGRLAVIGAQGEDGTGTDRGAAYVFDLNTGVQLHKLVAEDAGDGDLFGITVAISGSLAIVGASDEDGDGTDRGAAYVFDLNTGAQLFKLISPTPADIDRFGNAVAISGALAVVGAAREDRGGADRGAAYVFDLNTGNLLFTLTAADTEDSDFFGLSVAASGNLAVIGASREDGPGVDHGAAYVFDLTTGNQLFKLTAADSADDDRLGFSVAMTGSLAVAGAVLKNGEGNDRGAAYVFDLATGNQIAKLTATDGADSDQFGRSVALIGNFALVGSPGVNGAGSNRGAAYAFKIPLHQPDNRVGTGAFSGLGDNLYNSSASGQTLALTSRNLGQVNGFLTVNNDGDRGDDYTISGSPGNTNFAVRYLRGNGGFETNVTAAIIAGTHTEASVAPGEAGRVIRAEITPSPRLKRKVRVKGKVKTRITRTTFLTRMTTVSGVHDFKRDTIAISVRTQ